MTTEIEKLRQAIAALEAQRPVLGDSVVNTALAPLREKLKTLQSEAEDTAEELRQRKLVTVLFADIPALAVLGETLDAEDLHAVNALWNQLDALILKHGGRIDKHTGEGVMALWGAERVHEDDAEQAIRAALAMRQALQSLPILAGQELRLRVGINTGPVIVGPVGTTGEFTALGDTVNLAARLNDTATPGDILISHDTYRLVRGVFDVSIQPPLHVKGKSEAVQTYLVHAAKPRAFRLQEARGVEGIETSLIGRQTELEALQDAFRQLFGRHPLRLVTLIGEMGLGKSRLLHEFLAWTDPLPEDFYLFQGRSHPSETTTPYALWRDIFCFRFQIQDSDTLATVHEKMERGFVEFLPDDERAIEKAHIIGQLVGFDFSASPYLRGILQDPKQLRSLGLNTLTRFFVTAAETYPVVLITDDIHWADRGSLDALLYLCAHVPASTPFLVISTARPALFERIPDWGLGLTAARKLELRPLQTEESQALVTQILQKTSHIPPALRDLIVNGAEGNPFYLEELVKMLIDNHVIRPGEETWQIDMTRLHTAVIPPTLSGVLQARLDRLGLLERASLQRASVVGRVFWDSALKALSPEAEAEPTQLEESLAALRAKELIFQSPDSTFDGTQEYAFKHALLRDVTYETVLKRHRQQYHALVADWLSKASGERRGEYLSVIAEHYEKAGDHDRAVAVLLEAGERALNLSAFDEAFRFFQRALNLLHPRQTRDLAHVHLKIGEAFYRAGEFVDSVKSTEKALSLARQLSTSILLAACLAQLGQIYAEMGNYLEAETTLRQALPMARAAGIPARPTLARILYGLGNVYWRLGQPEQARTFCAESRDLARQIGDTHTLLLALNRLGVVMGTLGDAPTEEELYREALSLAVSVGNRERAAVALNNLGALADERGDLPQAQRYYLQAIEMAREIGAQQSLALYLINLGHSEIRLGQFQEATEHLREGLALADHLGAGPWSTAAVLFYARLFYQQGECERAFALIALARRQPAFSSDLARLVEQIFREWQISPAAAEAQLAAAPELEWKTAVRELLTA
ncbi:MAG: tetratricopeptide repeat protein [Anaerolineales bacterium]|nr:tetratricopeptide repeat protein [Anaerolineales bacterium]